MHTTLGLSLTDRMSLSRGRTLDLTLALLGSLLIAASAQLALYLPISPVPVTGQTFAVLLVGFALGWRRGLLSLALYLGEGLLGLPVFAGGGSGIPWLLGPTGGYLLGFLFAAGLVGALAERGFDRRWSSTLLAFALGQAVIYLFGALWLSTFVGLQDAYSTGVAPFLVGDLLKAVLAAVFLPFAWRLLGEGRRSGSAETDHKLN